MRKSILFFTSLLVALSLVLTACAAPTPKVIEKEVVVEKEVPVTVEVEKEVLVEKKVVETVVVEKEVVVEKKVIETVVVEKEVIVEKPEEVVEIRWFVGLGAGTDEPLFAPQQRVVADFNSFQDDIVLVLEIVEYDSAYDILATQIAAGNAPDIVGPVGVTGRDAFYGAWLDLAPLIEEFDYDLSDFDPSLVEFYLVEEEQLGLPFAIFPSFMFVNLELFDEAGLAYPPQEYGAPYVDENGVEHEWNMDTLRDVAMKLTVDANGSDATSPNFDPENIVQFGFGEQWTDPRGYATLFGAGSLVDADGNAQIPQNWRAAWNWFYDAMWVDYFHPNGPYGGSDIVGSGNWFQSGNIGMVHCHLWYAGCCMGELEAAWDTAAVPSYNGVTTAKMHADTFEIMKYTEHPEEAFKVLSYLIGPAVNTLTKIYGGMPARLSLQGGWFREFGAEKFPGQEINWQAVVDSMAYTDNPSHESYMPSLLEANDRCEEFWNLLANEPDLDVDAEIDRLQEGLQLIFEAAE